jgi:hypothetical protein
LTANPGGEQRHEPDGPDQTTGRPSGRFADQHPLIARFVSADSYGLILLLVVVTYLLAVSFPTDRGQPVVLAIQIATVWLTLHTARAPRSVRVAASVAFVGVAVLAVIDVFAVVSAPVIAVGFAVSGLLYLLAPIVVVRDIATRRSVERETVLGAIAAYLLVGMFFAFAYRAIGILQPTPFFGADGDGDTAQVLFFSFITLTTTGYGDLVPATNPGQTLAVLEAVLGQLFLVTAVAKIITAWKPKAWRASDHPDIDS